MRIAGQPIEVWVISTLCGVIVTIFTLWQKAETKLSAQTEKCAEIQRKCDQDKLEAKDLELANLKKFYDQVKQDQEAQLLKLKRAKK